MAGPSDRPVPWLLRLVVAGVPPPWKRALVTLYALLAAVLSGLTIAVFMGWSP